MSILTPPPPPQKKMFYSTKKKIIWDCIVQKQIDFEDFKV